MYALFLRYILHNHVTSHCFDFTLYFLTWAKKGILFLFVLYGIRNNVQYYFAPGDQSFVILNH